MDTSETYIKMCEKASEIQKDYPLPSVTVYCGRGIIKMGDDVYVSTEHGIVWLPRQDQLQEMVKSKSGFNNERMIGLELCDLYSWYQRSRPHDIAIEMRTWPSWEQLCLAFVMKEKYNKVWNGEGWI